MQKVIIIGRPNVGKSSLFNRLARARIAITSDTAGTTRDTNSVVVGIAGTDVRLIDSGGLDESTPMFANVAKKSLDEAKSADIILFMVDGKMMPDEADREIFYSLLRLKRPICLLINKIDSRRDEMRSYEFATFGAHDSINISVTHNTGIDELLAWIGSHLREEITPDSDEILDDLLEIYDENGQISSAADGQDTDFAAKFDGKNIRVGILGRVNVGKSSLLNALVRDSRAVVSDTAGTTIDPVNEIYEYNGRVFEFVDTAGIRKRGRIEGIERFALMRTKSVLERCDVALLVLDASDALTELDERIAGLIAQYHLGVAIVLNKWDASKREFDEISREIRDRFKFLAYAPIISVSALSTKRVAKIYPLIAQIYANFTQKIQTARLNEAMEEITTAHPLPHEKGKLVKIYYAVQYDTAPPRIALVMNRPRALHFSYERYITNQLRERFDLAGTPVILTPRKRGAGEDESGENNQNRAKNHKKESKNEK